MKFTWTTLQVSNLDKSLAFYHDLLGLPIHSRFPAKSGEIAMLGTPDGTKLELLCTGAPLPHPVGLGISMGFAPDNMDVLLRTLEAHDIPLPPPVSPNPSLRFYFLPDPDGYTIQLVEELV